MKNNLKYLLLLPASICVSLLSSCFEANSTPSVSQSEHTSQDVSSEIEEDVCAYCKELPTATFTQMDPLAHHTPTKFAESSVNYTTLDVCDGVVRKTYSFTTNKNYNSQVVVTEVDLNKAHIAAGTTNNSVLSVSKSTPIKQVEAFLEDNTNTKVVAAVNADFFGGSSPVNAFVKDSVIIKDSHNDKGIYDYTNLNADIPASMPMLFGVSGNVAQVAPIIKNGTVEETIQSKLFAELTIVKDKKSSVLTRKIIFNDSVGSKTETNIITSPDCEGTALPGSKVLNIKKHESSSTRLHGEVAFIQDVVSNSTYIANDEYFYVIIPEGKDLGEINVGDVISYNVNSPDDTWQYYDTIIGCRQALVIDGQIPATVAKENSNGAQNTNIPRTAVGVMPDGKVAIFSVESLYYSGKNSSSSDPHGLSLPELADFMRYYGVYNGANFDGGGSTQLISLNPTSNELEVIVRSSDYGTYTLTNSRAVINTLLVYIEENK